MAFDSVAPSQYGDSDADAIRNYWLGMLQRLKVHVELAELDAMHSSSPEPDPRDSFNGEET